MSKYDYLVMPGYVMSAYDDDQHYVGAEQLIRLYNVNPDKCLVRGKDCRGRTEEFLSSLHKLYPRSNGDYRL